MGLFSKKEKKVTTKDDDEIHKVSTVVLEDIYLIPVSEIPDNSKQDILSSVEHVRNIIRAKNLKETCPMLYHNDKTGQVEARWVEFWLPVKLEGESILWYRKKEDGLINKTLRAYEVLTNYRCYFYDLKTQTFSVYPISDLLGVVINNQKRISESQRSGSFTGVGNHGTFVGTTGGFSTGESETFGDVNILDEGEIVFTFFTIPDPSGLANLIKYEIKRVQGMVEKLQEQDEEREKIESRVIQCPKCQNPNPSDSQFCNKCGHKFTTVCTQCKNINPSDSSFCNKCGFALQ